MLTPLHRAMQWSALFGTTGYYHIYLSNFNLQHFSDWHLRDWRGSRVGIVGLLFPLSLWWRQRSIHLHPERTTILLTQGFARSLWKLAMRIYCLWERCNERDVCACLWAMSSYSACGQGTKLPVISVPLNPSSMIISVISIVQQWSLTYASYWRLNTPQSPTACLDRRHGWAPAVSLSNPPAPRRHMFLQRIHRQPYNAVNANISIHLWSFLNDGS